MFYIDTNILIYLNDTDSHYYKSCTDIFYSLLADNRIVINEIVINEFFSLVTNSKKMNKPWDSNKAKEYIKNLLLSVKEVHFLNSSILSEAIESVSKFNIRSYNIYDHLIAYSMKNYGIKKIITANIDDFKKYSFIEEIITPQII